MFSTVLRLFSFLSAKPDNSSCWLLLSQDVYPFLQTIFTFTDNRLLLQFLGFVLIAGIFKMSLVLRVSCTSKRPVVHFQGRFLFTGLGPRVLVLRLADILFRYCFSRHFSRHFLSAFFCIIARSPLRLLPSFHPLAYNDLWVTRNETTLYMMRLSCLTMCEVEETHPFRSNVIITSERVCYLSMQY